MRRPLLAMTLAFACAQADGVDHIESAPDEPLDHRAVEVVDPPPPPISGGTLLLLPSSIAIASDPDRDLVHVVDLVARTERATIELAPGDEPGRAALDGDGMVHVVLRNGAAIVVIDPVEGFIVERTPTCANPRGIAFDAAHDRMLVACAGGQLVADGVMRTIAPDLRDVVVTEDGTIYVTRFRSAEVLTLDEDLRVVARELPPPLAQRIPSTAWRTIEAPRNGWLMLHQDTTQRPVEIDHSPKAPVSAYAGTPSGCDGPVAARISMRMGGDPVLTTRRLPLAPLTVDIAIAPHGERMAVAIAGRDGSAPTDLHGHSLEIVYAHELETHPTDDQCLAAPALDLDAQLTAVTFVSDETLLAQSREPAALYVVALGPESHVTEIPLAGASVRDTGHDLFHRDVGTGIACASCHPEGGDDGRVWRFDPGDVLRRTMSLRAGIADSDPLHWEGDLESFDALVDEVMERRMGGLHQTRERKGALKRWVERMRPYRSEHVDDRSVTAGRDIYVKLGCERCHDAAALRAGATLEIDGEDLQAPSLRGVALHPRYMHDGRAGDLGEALDDMIARTVPSVALADDERDAVIAYLESL